MTNATQNDTITIATLLCGRGVKTVRKVRASQSRIAVNGSRRRLQGECNRNIPHCFYSVRVERRGKSSPRGRRLFLSVNPIRCNTDWFRGVNRLLGGPDLRWLEVCGDAERR